MNANDRNENVSEESGYTSNLENGTSDSKVEEISKLMKEILRIVNPNLKDDIMFKTPLRYAKAMMEFTQGYNDDSEKIVSEAIFENEDYTDVIKIKKCHQTLIVLQMK